MISFDFQRLSIAEPNYLLAALTRVPAWLSLLSGSLICLALPTAFLAGLLASRHRILDARGEHLPLLRRLALWGIVLGWDTGVVLALQHIGLIDVAPDRVFINVHLFPGTFAEIGYAALFGLVAYRLATTARHRVDPCARSVRLAGAR